MKRIRQEPDIQTDFKVLSDEFSCKQQWESDLCEDEKIKENKVFRKSKQSTKSVSLLVSFRVSTKKSAKVCSVLSNFGISIQLPSQSQFFKNPLRIIKIYTKQPKFKSKKTNNFLFISMVNVLIVIGSQNEDKTVKLTCKFCKKGSAAEI